MYAEVPYYAKFWVEFLICKHDKNRALILLLRKGISLKITDTKRQSPVKKVLSSQDSMVATQLSTPQKRALAKQFQNPTPLNQWEKLLNSHNIRTGATPQDLFRVLTNLSTQCMETEKKWHLEKKGDIPITSKKKVPTTCFGFYHGNKSSVVSKDYTDQVQKILLSPLKKDQACHNLFAR